MFVFFIFKTHLFLFGSHLVHLTSCYLSTIFTGPEKEKFSKALLCIQKKAEEMIEVTAEIWTLYEKIIIFYFGMACIETFLLLLSLYFWGFSYGMGSFQLGVLRWDELKWEMGEEQ